MTSKSTRWMPPAWLVVGVAVALWLVAVSVHAESQGESRQRSPVYRSAGQSLPDAILELRSRGLKVVYTSQLVSSEMVVSTEPHNGGPKEILEQILLPFGLAAKAGPSGSVVVASCVGANLLEDPVRPAP